MLNKNCCFVFVISLLHLLVAFCSADDNFISILDTSGVTRASSQVDQIGQVDFNIKDSTGNPAQGVEVSLANATTGETFTSIAQDGVVTFSGLSPGAWTVACATPGITFTSVGISSALAGVGTAAGAVGAGTLASGTAAGASGAAATAVGVGAGGAAVGASTAVVGSGALLTAGGVAAAAAGTAVAIDQSNDDNDDEDPLSPFS